jgi:hypothetical protein
VEERLEVGSWIEVNGFEDGCVNIHQITGLGVACMSLETKEFIDELRWLKVLGPVFEYDF